MTNRICIQAGHSNVKYNSIVALRGSTGAPNEMSFNVDIRDKVSDELRKRGFEVQGTDANANDDPNITNVDWDLFLSIHYDADVYTTEPKNGGFADYPEPSTDGATKESQRICKIINETYFPTTGIPCVTKRSNANTRYFYMWKYLTAKTPCVILECGVGMHTPEDHQTLHFNRPLVVEGIVRSICKSFNVPYENIPEPPTDPCSIQNARIKELESQLMAVEQANEENIQDEKELVAELEELKDEFGTLNKKLLDTETEKELLNSELNSRGLTITKLEDEIRVLTLKLSSIPENENLSPTLTNVISLFRLWLKDWLRNGS